MQQIRERMWLWFRILIKRFSIIWHPLQLKDFILVFSSCKKIARTCTFQMSESQPEVRLRWMAWSLSFFPLHLAPLFSLPLHLPPLLFLLFNLLPLLVLIFTSLFFLAFTFASLTLLALTFISLTFLALKFSLPYFLCPYIYLPYFPCSWIYLPLLSSHKCCKIFSKFQFKF